MDLIAILSSGFREAFGPTAAWFALVAIGLNLHFGFAGLINFGMIGFALVGSYGTAVAVSTFGWSLWVAILFALGCSIALALILGIPTLRLRADYFAIVTIAAAEVLRLTFKSGSLTAITGGPYGLGEIAGEFYALQPNETGLRLFGNWTYRADQVWATSVTWALVGVFAIVVFLLVRSPWGRALRAIREDEDAARALGKNAFLLKLQALVLGGVIGGVGGIMIVIQNSGVTDQTYLPRQTFFVWVIVLLGGAATVLGPILGSILFWFLYTGLNALLRQLAREDLLPLGGDRIGAVTFIAVGIALVLLIVFRPQGILGDRNQMTLTAR